MAESYLVIPDTHGEYETVCRVIDDNDSKTDTFVFLGDVIDGPDTAKLIRLIRSLGERAITIAGNHEWVCRNALANTNDPNVAIWRDLIWPKYEVGLLASYGLKRTSDWQTNALQLREAMSDTGDWEWLSGLKPYYANDDFIAIHAGPETDIPWNIQVATLDNANNETARTIHEPTQIFSEQLAVVRDIPETVDKRVFVSGHNHYNLTSTERNAARRICLASNINNGAPLLTWNSLTNHIKAYY